MRVRMLGGPTVVLEIGGFRLLTDPTFDPPGEYPGRGGYSLVKTAAPLIDADELPPIDAVLLSHDQHADNLDRSGRAALARAPKVFSTRSAAERLGDGITPLSPWSWAELSKPGVASLRIMAVPAQHGPDDTEHLTGEVIGFVLSSGGAREAGVSGGGVNGGGVGGGVPTVYLSGDNASLAVVREIALWVGTIDVAILHAGGASTPLVPGEFLTLTSPWAAQAATILDAARVFVVHTDSWAHFTESAADVRKAFADAGLSERLLGCEPGEATLLE